MRTQKLIPIEAIKPHPRNARTHSKKQIQQVAESIQKFGYTAPVLLDENLTLLAGHARLEAAKLLGLTEMPVIIVDDLSPAKKRAYMLADNKIAQNAGWDREMLGAEVFELPELLVEDNLDI